MKKNIATLSRAKRMLESDKSPMSEECKSLALSDITRTLKEYFVIDGDVKFDATLQSGKYVVRIAFDADRIKNFAILK